MGGGSSRSPRGGTKRCCAGAGEGMEAREREFGPLLLHSVRPGDGVHPQAAFQHQALAHLHPVLQVLGQASPAHHLQLARGIIRAQPFNLHGHLGHGGLVVLGVTHLGRLDHLHLQQALVHGSTVRQGAPS